MKTGKCLFVKSATAAAISILLAASPVSAGPVGINFQDSNTGGAVVTNTAFGIDPANWLNLTPGGSGTQTLPVAGGSLTVTWNTYGTWYSSYSDGIPGDSQVYYGWAEFDPVWNAAPTNGQYFLTISGLSSIFTNGCVVQTISADNSASSFQPVTITNDSQVLSYSAWVPFADDQIGGVSTVSTPITGNIITLSVPQGAWTAPGGWLQAGTLAGVILRDPPRPAADVGINFRENNTGLTGKSVTETAFGLPVDNWLNMTPGGSGSATIPIPSGGLITVNWSAGNWNTYSGNNHFTDGVTGDEEVYYGWLDFGWGANSSYVTLSGLSAAFTNGYQIQVAASVDDGQGFQPILVTNVLTPQSLSFSAFRNPDGPLGGLSSPSTTMTDDSVDFLIPQGAQWPNRASICGIIVAGAAVIQSQPHAPTNTVYAGDSFSVFVGAIGASLHYQWQYNGANISGATNSSYSLSNAVSGNSGNYDVVITNSYGSVTSSVAAVTVFAQRPPTFATITPASQVRYPGGSAYFAVTSDGSPPFQYQWFRAGSLVSGATNATLTLFGLTAADATNYSCSVSNVMGSVTSGPAALAVTSPLGYQNVVLTDGPLAFYKLSEPTPPGPDIAINKGSLGSAGNGVNFPGVLHQVPGAIVGDTDTAMEYSAIDTSSDDGGVPTIVPYNAAFNPSGSFTVEAWLRPTENGVGNAQCPLINRDPDTAANNSGWNFFQRDASAGWNFQMFNGNAHDTVFDITGGAYTVGQWCHLVAVYDASLTKVTLYLNGAQVASTTQANGTFNVNTNYPLSIGGYSDGSQNPFVGDIDEVAIYPTALSSAQVLAHYQNGTNPSRGTPYSSLVLSDGAAEYLRLGEPAHNLTVNSGTLGAAANGTYVHTVNDLPGPAAPGYSGIESNNVAMGFNGTNSYVELDNPDGLNFSDQITLEAWVKPNTNRITSYTADVVAHGVNDTDDGEVMIRLTDVPLGAGSAYYQVGSWNGAAGPSAASVIPAADLSGTNWVYLAGTYDGANWNLYRNGVLVNSQPGGFGALPIANANWAIGARGRWKNAGGYPDNGLQRTYAGGIDQVAIYSHALTAQQILSHYYMAVDGTTNVPLTFVVQPVNQRVVTNTTATFNVVVAGSPIPTLQWYRVIGGVTNLITDATNATYTTPPVQDSDTGNAYFVIASNLANQVASSTAFLTAGHLTATSGFLENDEFFNLGSSAAALTSDLYPNSSWLGANAPNKSEFLNSFEDKQDLPGTSGERIYGWFTPSVSGDYIFFIASDDAAALWLSTNDSPAHAYQIAQDQGWMAARDWTCSNTGTGEYAYFAYGEWRSDQFELNGGPNAFASAISGWAAWPTFNSVDGGIPLVAGTKYYIELDHFQGGGGQNAAVTYKLAGQPDPTPGAAPLLTGSNIAALVPDVLLPKPQPRIQKVSLTGSTLKLSGTNGLVNAAFNVLTATNFSLPVSNWTVFTSARFDTNGNFSITNTPSAGNQNYYLIQVP